MNFDSLLYELTNICNTFNPSDFKEPNVEQEFQWKKKTKVLFDLLKSEEKDLNPSNDATILDHLYVDGMQAEQVWQQVEMQNAPNLRIFTNPKASASMADHHLCVMVANVCNDATREETNKELEEEEEEEQDEIPEKKGPTGSCDEGVWTGDSSDEDALSDLDLEEPNFDNVLDGEIDFDADAMHELATGPDDDDDDDESDLEGEMEDEEDIDKEENEGFSKVFDDSKKFESSELDTRFLNLRESEWIADEDILGEDNFGDINLLAEEDSGDEESPKYEDFFGPIKESGDSSKKKVHFNLDKFEDDEQDTTQQSKDTTQQSKEEQEEKQEEEEESFVQEVEKNSNAKAITKFESQLQEDVQTKHNLEEELFVNEKPWFLMGEARAKDRPENSALEQYIEFNPNIRLKPVITEETSAKLEKLILSRVRTQAWDDVEQKVKPNADPYRYKRELVLDHEKSSRSLAQIYEEEYLKQKEAAEAEASSSSSGGVANTTLSELLKGAGDEPVDEKEVHKNIRKQMEDVFTKLDLLTNLHYTPKPVEAEVKMVKNVRALAMEEAVPETTSEATLLAPQEVLNSKRGNVMSTSEATITDRRRWLRSKKLHQRKRGERHEEKLKAKLKTRAAGDNEDNHRRALPGAEAAKEAIVKAIKKGQMSTLDTDGPSVRSSASVFSEMQSLVHSRKDNKKKRNADEPHVGLATKKKKKDITVKKLLL